MAEILRRETWLLILSALVLTTGLAIIGFQAGRLEPQVAAIAALVIGLSFVVHFAMRKRHPQADPLLFPTVTMLVAIGLVFVLRLKPDLFLWQAAWASLGYSGIFAVVAWRGKIEFLSRYKYLSGSIGALLLGVAAIAGVDIGGHKSWVILGPIRFQPSEFAKIFLVIFLAGYLAERRALLTLGSRRFGPLVLPSMRFFGPLFVVLGVTMGVLIFQHDIGAALLYFAATVAIVYAACGVASHVAWASGLFSLGGYVAYRIFPHVRTRIDIWIDPWQDPSGRAYQVIQSLLALGSGGILGSGIGLGQPGLIPEVHTDFIFAAIGEELGLAGSVAIIILYVILVYRGFRIALTCRNDFLALVAAGLAVYVGFQVFIIVGGVTTLLPLTGITLPFVSYGGSSMFANCLGVGILLGLSGGKGRERDA